MSTMGTMASKTPHRCQTFTQPILLICTGKHITSLAAACMSYFQAVRLGSCLALPQLQINSEIPTSCGLQKQNRLSSTTKLEHLARHQRPSTRHFSKEPRLSISGVRCPAVWKCAVTPARHKKCSSLAFHRRNVRQRGSVV